MKPLYDFWSTRVGRNEEDRVYQQIYEQMSDTTGVEGTRQVGGAVGGVEITCVVTFLGARRHVQVGDCWHVEQVQCRA